MTTDIASMVIEKIAELKMTSKHSISKTDLLSDLDINSLDAVTIVYEVEDEYGISIDNDKLATLTTVDDIVLAAEELLQDNKQ